MSPRKVYADQADIDTPLVRELVAAQFPQWAALPLEPVDSGGLVNAIYRLGSDLSVRLPLRPSITDLVRRDQAKLAAFVDAFRRIDLPDRPPAYPGERRTRAPMVSMDSSTWKVIGELDGLIDTRAALASWEESLAAPYDGREVWVHSDLTPGNVLVSAEGRLTAPWTWATRLRGRGRVLSQALIVSAHHKDTSPALTNDARHVIGEVLAAPQ